MTPLGHHPPEELTVVPLTDMPPSPAVVGDPLVAAADQTRWVAQRKRRGEPG
jgi:hypothetical protein